LEVHGVDLFEIMDKGHPNHVRNIDGLIAYSERSSGQQFDPRVSSLRRPHY
jgi:hypothetical protein